MAEAGRAVLIWVALVAVYGSQRPLSQNALVGISVAALTWFAALRSAAFSGRPVFGPAVASEMGTAVGFAVVVALNSSMVGLHLSLGWLIVCALAVFSSATVWDRCVDWTSAGRQRVLVVGMDGLDAALAEELGDCRHAPFDLVGAIAGADDLEAVIEARRPDIVVLTNDTAYEAALERLLDCGAGVRVASFASFYEWAFGRVPVRQITPAWFMSLLHPRQRIYTRFSKRAFDVLVAVLGLVAVAPLLVALALLTRSTKAPVFYRQIRVGEGGSHFTIYKLRTMGCDAEHDGPMLSGDADTRATRIGRVLRRTHLDELPQLWNVLKGDMSIVGPRPERPEFIEMLEAAVPFWNRRLLVKPGITGWAQVRCDYASDGEAMERKLSYDLWYLRHRSLLLDLAVCVMTFFAVLGRPLRP